MKTRTILATLAFGLCVILLVPGASAQTEQLDEPQNDPYDPRDEPVDPYDPIDDDRYDYDDDRRGANRMALGIGAGVVEPDGIGEIYYHAALRFRLFNDEDRWERRDRRDERNRRYDDRRDDRRDRYDGRRNDDRGDIQAWIEPEIGYWERNDTRSNESDLSIGVNALGVIPGRRVDYFFGVGLGLHFLDTRIEGLGSQPALDESDEVLGGNFHIGLDVHLGEHVSAFGVGRLDVVEGREDTLQSKVFMGLRFGF